MKKRKRVVVFAMLPFFINLTDDLNSYINHSPNHLSIEKGYHDTWALDTANVEEKLRVNHHLTVGLNLEPSALFQDKVQKVLCSALLFYYCIPEE